MKIYLKIEPRKTSWNFIIGWVERMTMRFGGTVYDENGKTWDWGQALCRELHGEDWPNSPDYSNINEMEYPPDYVIQACENWESNPHPSWVLNTTLSRN